MNKMYFYYYICLANISSCVTSPGNFIQVRLALGETQLVMETREFLQNEGICLDVFGQPNVQRSKTTIIVKNLPVGTSAEELQQVFNKHGDLTRVIMPPHSITALLEFSDAAEARKAFTNLAYSKVRFIRFPYILSVNFHPCKKCLSWRKRSLSM